MRDRYNCRNLFLKVQSDGELRKSPDKPFHALMHGSIANKGLRLCCCLQWYPHVTNISKLDLMPNFSMIEKVVQQECAIDYLVSKYTFLLINQFIQTDLFWAVHRVFKLVL